MPRRRRRQILLVDDNRHARLFLTQILNAVGMEVQQAASGPEALVLLKTERFDAIIADMYMQPMDGIALTREIRALPDKTVSKLPIVMASAQTSRAVIEGGRAAGVTGFIAKPFSAAAVLTHLESALSPQKVVYVDVGSDPETAEESTEGALAYI
jgi:two-component system chemotaxis response regulator CheY